MRSVAFNIQSVETISTEGLNHIFQKVKERKTNDTFFLPLSKHTSDYRKLQLRVFGINVIYLLFTCNPG